MQKTRGFTIIELIVVIAIIAVLAAVVMVNVVSYINKSRDAAVKGSLSTLLTNGTIVMEANGDYENFFSATEEPGATYFKPIYDSLIAQGYVADNIAYSTGESYTKWCASVQLKVDSDKYFCVDSSGVKQESEGAVCESGSCGGTPCTPNCSCAADTCIPNTCSDLCDGTCEGTKDCNCYPDCEGKVCGSDGCEGSCPPGCEGTFESCSCNAGGTCDACSEGQACSSGACCTLNTCSSLGYNCGDHSDNCGGTINCGECAGVCQSGVCEWCGDGICQSSDGGVPICSEDCCPTVTDEETCNSYSMYCIWNGVGCVTL